MGVLEMKLFLFSPPQPTHIQLKPMLLRERKLNSFTCRYLMLQLIFSCKTYTKNNATMVATVAFMLMMALLCGVLPKWQAGDDGSTAQPMGTLSSAGVPLGGANSARQPIYL